MYSTVSDFINHMWGKSSGIPTLISHAVRTSVTCVLQVYTSQCAAFELQARRLIQPKPMTKELSQKMGWGQQRLASTPSKVPHKCQLMMPALCASGQSSHLALLLAYALHTLEKL